MGVHGRWTGPATGSHHATPPSSWRPGPRLVLLVAGALLLLGTGLGAGLLLASGPAGAASVPTTSAPPGGAVGDPAAAGRATVDGSHPTMLGEVVRVDAGDEVLVRVDGRDVPVAVLGLDAPRTAGPGRSGECGAVAALTFADATLAGRMVTLVPDPTVPEVDEEGRRLAYVVLASQLNFTDAALVAGVARADTSRELWYREVFERGETRARDDGRGVWGDPCQAEPGEPMRGGT